MIVCAFGCIFAALWLFTIVFGVRSYFVGHLLSYTLASRTPADMRLQLTQLRSDKGRMEWTGEGRTPGPADPAFFATYPAKWELDAYPPPRGFYRSYGNAAVWSVLGLSYMHRVHPLGGGRFEWDRGLIVPYWVLALATGGPAGVLLRIGLRGRRGTRRGFPLVRGDENAHSVRG